MSGEALLRTEKIEVLLTLDEKMEIAALANRSGLDLSTWVRMILLKEYESAFKGAK